MAKSALQVLVVVLTTMLATLGAMADGAIGPTTILGGPGGAAFRMQCNSGDLLVGVDPDAMKDLNSVEPLCQHFEGSAATGEPYPVGKEGVNADFMDGFANGLRVACPSNTVVEGISVQTSHVNLVHSFKFNCRNPLDHNYVSSSWIGTRGGAAARTQTADCGGGAVAIGLIGRAGELIDAVGLLCQVTAVDPAAAPLAKPQTVMLESTNFPGMFIRHQNWQGLLTKLSSELDYKDATFNLGPALTGQGKTAVSFESAEYPGYYLRHKNFVLVLEKSDGSQQFAQDASFTRIKTTGSKGNQFESVNFPGLFIRHKNFKLVLEKKDGTAQFNADASFVVEAPLNSPPADNGDENAAPPPDNDNGTGDDNGAGGATAATDTTIYDEPQGNDLAYLSAGDPVTIVACNDDNWCQISKPKKGWVWGDDLNH